MEYSFPLEERTEEFAAGCRKLVKLLMKTIASIEDGKQLIRSSGSVAANYIEANESISKKDFVYRIKICRKETKESRLWLKLIDPVGTEEERLRSHLLQESTELMLIFSSIIAKTKI